MRNDIFTPLFDISRDLFIITDLDGKIIDSNNSARALLGIPEKGESSNFKDFFIHEEDWNNYKKRIEPTGSISGLDIMLRSNNGQDVIGLLTSTVINRNNRETHTFLIHDVSRFIEASMEATKLNLEIMEKNQELRKAYNTITHQEKLASIGELSAGIAHEINNPLAFIQSNMKSLYRYITKILSFDIITSEEDAGELEFLKEDIEQIFTETHQGLARIENITKSLKRFSRMDEENLTEEFDVNRAIEDTITIVKNQCPSHVQIDMVLNKIPLISCYANDISQVLLNMIINSIQAMPEQKGTEELYLKIETCPFEHFIQIRIEDNGKGIPDDIAEKIYDPFFTTKDIGKGTGLGLGISHSIITQKHKGAIWLESNKDPTLFIINLPIKGV